MPRGEATGKTYVNIHTELLDNPKLLLPGPYNLPERATAYIALITYSRRHLTDGILAKTVAAQVISRYLGDGPVKGDRRAADLAAIGLLKATRWDYRIPDYGDWQQTKTDLSALSERQSERARKPRRPRADPNQRLTSGTAAGQQIREEKRSPLPHDDLGKINPRAAGTNPRAQGTNPRANGAAQTASRAEQALVAFITRELSDGDTDAERQRLVEHLRAEQRAKSRDPDLADQAMATYAQQHPLPQI